jgi:hypothetical protein
LVFKRKRFVVRDEVKKERPHLPFMGIVDNNAEEGDHVGGCPSIESDMDTARLRMDLVIVSVTAKGICEYKKTHLQGFRDLRFRNLMCFSDISGNCSVRRYLDLRIEHLQHFLKRQIFNYAERPVARCNPLGDQKSEFTVTVR